MQVLKYSQPRWRRAAAATGLKSETDERYLTYKHSKAVAKAGYCRSRHFLPKAERPKDRWSSARLLLGFAVRLTRAAHPPAAIVAALVREWWGEAWRETRRQREEKAILLQRCPSAGNTKATPRLFSLVRISSSSWADLCFALHRLKNF